MFCGWAVLLLLSNGILCLFISWKEEEIPNAYLFDQALALIALTKEGNWEGGDPINEEAVIAESLVQFLIAEQKIDGHWARNWNPNTGAELVDDMWVGDQAWCVLAMMVYYLKSSNSSLGIGTRGLGKLPISLSAFTAVATSSGRRPNLSRFNNCFCCLVALPLSIN